MLTNVINRVMKDAVYRSRWALAFSLGWSVIMVFYYFTIGYFDAWSNEKLFWSWFFNLSLWYVVLVVFKIIQTVYSFKLKNKKQIDFYLLTIVFLIINFFEVLGVTITPQFFIGVFSKKLNNAFTISSMVVASYDVFLFVLTFFKINREKYSKNECDFLLSRKYVSRMSGLFNMMIITINGLLLCGVGLQPNGARIIAVTYTSIGSVFALMSLFLAVRLMKKRKANNKKSR